jgi:hypothetical protein
MTSIIKQVSFSTDNAKNLLDKLKEHLAIQPLSFTLSDGEILEGLVTEIGLDYIIVMASDKEIIIPVSNIKYYSFFNT